jgi:UDPglucose 6-dehydrogenase
VIFYDVVDKDLPNFTKDINYAIGSSNISFVCVPTPTNDKGEIDLSYINGASKNVGKAIAKKEDYHLVEI